MKEESQEAIVGGGSGRLSSAAPPRLMFHSFHGEPPEPTGLRTPPFRLPGSVPFRWEEVPGKPWEEPGTFGLAPNSGPSSPLELPPRLAAAVMERATSSTASLPKSPDFQYQRSCHALPSLMSRSSRIKNYKERMFWLIFGRKKGKVDMVWWKMEEICPSASSSSSSELQASPFCDEVHHEEKKKVTATRLSRSKSFGVDSSRVWASIYGSLKKVVPWQMEYK